MSMTSTPTGEGGLSSSLTDRRRASWLLSTNMFKKVCREQQEIKALSHCDGIYYTVSLTEGILFNVTNYGKRGLFYLQPRSWIEALHNLGVIKKAVSTIADGHYSSAAAVDVNAVHVSEGQADVGGRLRQNGEALVGCVGPLGQTEHGYCGQLVEGI